MSRMTSPGVSEDFSSSTNAPMSEESSSELAGLSRLVASGITLFMSRTCSTGHSSRSATSSSDGSRLSSAESALKVRAIFWIFSDICTGTRMVRPLSVTARCTACRTHHVA